MPARSGTKPLQASHWAPFTDAIFIANLYTYIADHAGELLNGTLELRLSPAKISVLQNMKAKLAQEKKRNPALNRKADGIHLQHLERLLTMIKSLSHLSVVHIGEKKHQQQRQQQQQQQQQTALVADTDPRDRNTKQTLACNLTLMFPNLNVVELHDLAALNMAKDHTNTHLLRKTKSLSLRGLAQLRHKIERLTVHGSISTLEALVVMCLGDQVVRSQSEPWTALLSLSARHNNLKALDDSTKMLPNVEVLDFSHNNLTQVKHFQYCRNLQHLNMGYNQITTVMGVNTVLGNVTTLILRNNQLEDISPLAKCYSLERLDVSHNYIPSYKAVAVLKNLPFLTAIAFEGNPFCVNRPRGYRNCMFAMFKGALREAVGGFFLDNVLATPKEKQQALTADLAALIRALESKTQSQTQTIISSRKHSTASGKGKGLSRSSKIRSSTGGKKTRRKKRSKHGGGSSGGGSKKRIANIQSPSSGFAQQAEEEALEDVDGKRSLLVTLQFVQSAEQRLGVQGFKETLQTIQDESGSKWLTSLTEYEKTHQTLVKPSPLVDNKQNTRQLQQLDGKGQLSNNVSPSTATQQQGGSSNTDSSSGSNSINKRSTTTTTTTTTTATTVAETETAAAIVSATTVVASPGALARQLQQPVSAVVQMQESPPKNTLSAAASPVPSPLSTSVASSPTPVTMDAVSSSMEVAAQFVYPNENRPADHVMEGFSFVASSTSTADLTTPSDTTTVPPPLSVTPVVVVAAVADPVSAPAEPAAVVPKVAAVEQPTNVSPGLLGVAEVQEDVATTTAAAAAAAVVADASDSKLEPTSSVFTVDELQLLADYPDPAASLLDNSISVESNNMNTGSSTVKSSSSSSSSSAKYLEPPGLTELLVDQSFNLDDDLDVDSLLQNSYDCIAERVADGKATPAGRVEEDSSGIRILSLHEASLHELNHYTGDMIQSTSCGIIISVNTDSERVLRLSCDMFAPQGNDTQRHEICYLIDEQDNLVELEALLKGKLSENIAIQLFIQPPVLRKTHQREANPVVVTVVKEEKHQGLATAVDAPLEDDVGNSGVFPVPQKTPSSVKISLHDILSPTNDDSPLWVHENPFVAQFYEQLMGSEKPCEGYLMHFETSMTADACGQLGCELDSSSSSSSQSATDSNSSSGGDTVEQASAENDQQDGDVSRFDEIDTNGFVLFADDRVYILQSTETPDQAADRLAAAAAAVQPVNTEGVTAAQERGQRVPLVLICSHKLANLKTFVFGFMFLYFRLEFANDASTSSTDVQRHVLITRNKALTYKIINYLSNTDAVLEITNADSTIVSNINTDVFNNKTTMNVKLYQPVLELMVPKLDLFAASTSHDSQRGRFDSNNVRPTVSVTETKREYVLLRRSIIITEEQIFICAESFAQLSAPVKPKTKSLASKLFGMNSDTDTKVKPRFRVLQTLQREHFSHAKTKESTKQYFTFELVFGTKNAFTRELSNKSTLVLRVPDRATFKKIQNCMF